jgi:hypothetical protein
MDVHVPGAITERLRALDIDVLTAQDDGMEQADDSELLDRADHLGREIVTQDEDFLVLASLRQRGGQEFCGIFFGYQDRSRNREYADCLHVYAALGERHEVRNQVTYMR